MRMIPWLWVAALALGACRKPQPSPEYLEASGTYTTLLAKYGDDAFSEPEMEHIEQLLGQVSPKSSDAAAAAELKGRIAAERKRVEQEALEREKAIASATAPQPAVDFGTRPVEPTVIAVPDAGPSSELLPGMTLAAVRSVSEGCFVRSGPMKLRNLDRTESDAEMYDRVDSTLCRKKYPAFEARFLVFKDEKLVGDFDKSAVTQLVPQKPLEPPKAPPLPTPAPKPPVEPGGDKPPTPQPAPTTPGENTGPAPTGP